MPSAPPSVPMPKALASFRREMRSLARPSASTNCIRMWCAHFVNQARDVAQFQRSDLGLDNPALAALSGIASQ